MGRAKAIIQSEFPYNISARCVNREWFNLPMDQVWKIFSEELYMTSKMHGLKIYSFVLMSNHFHLIARTTDSDISQCLHRLMGVVSRRLNEAGNRQNETFAGRNFKTVLHEQSYFLSAYKYNYRNPVEAGLCERVEAYPFSTLYGLLGQAHLLIPVVEDVVLFEDVEGTIKWLNTQPAEEKLEAVRYALKRPHFASKKERATNRPLFAPGELL